MSDLFNLPLKGGKPEETNKEKTTEEIKEVVKETIKTEAKTEEPEVVVKQEEEQAPVVDELYMLKERAKLMGITHSNNISVEALKQKIKDKLEGNNSEEPKEETNTVSVKQKKVSLRKYLYDRDMKLVRVRITNLDPKKKDLPGEIITIANEHLGTVRKYVPFGEVTDGGYHIPYCIYKFLRDRRFVNIKVTRKGGREHVETSMAREFSIDVLPPLTKEELNRLATAQIAAGTAGTSE